MTWLALVFALELGIAPHIGVIQYVPQEVAIHDWQIGYTELSVEATLFGFLFAGGGVRTYVIPTAWDNWIPNTTVYDWVVGLRWWIIELRWGYLEAGYRWRCFHPTCPYLPLLEREITGLEGRYEELYLRLECKIGGAGR